MERKSGFSIWFLTIKVSLQDAFLFFHSIGTFRSVEKMNSYLDVLIETFSKIDHYTPLSVQILWVNLNSKTTLRMAYAVTNEVLYLHLGLLDLLKVIGIICSANHIAAQGRL